MQEGGRKVETFYRFLTAGDRGPLESKVTRTQCAFIVICVLIPRVIFKPRFICWRERINYHQMLFGSKGNLSAASSGHFLPCVFTLGKVWS